MKKIICVFFVILMCAALAVGCLATDKAPRLIDGADILTDSEESTLLAKLDEISERQKVDVVIVTVPTTDGEDIMDYADDFYDEKGYGFGEEYDGVLLLVATEDGERGELWMSTCGYGITAFPDSTIDTVLDRFADSYNEGVYAKAFGNFADDCDDYITIARENEKFDPLMSAVIAVAVGFLIAFIVTGVMKGKLKSVRAKYTASDYTKDDSLIINEHRDFFLYTTVTRREKPKNNSDSSTHTSSSGRTHGGGGRSL